MAEVDDSSGSDEYVSAEEGPKEDEGSPPSRTGVLVVETAPLPVAQLEAGEGDSSGRDASSDATTLDVPAPLSEVGSLHPEDNHHTSVQPTEEVPGGGVVEPAVDQVSERQGNSEVPEASPALPTPVSPTPASPTPVPPPRRKRKKKYDKSSLENLVEIDDQQQRQRRSYTISGTNPRKDLESSLQLSISSPDSDNTPEREVSADVEEASQAAGDSHVLGPRPLMEGDGQTSNDVPAADRTSKLLQNLSMEERSRSNTPTPSISIQPELEWTSGVLSGTENEVVTMDTIVTRARGSTSTANVQFASDEDSVDGLEDREELAVLESPDEEEDKDTQDAATEHEQSERTTSPVDTDKAILMSTMVKNLDTGEVIPLSAAEERIPQGHGWSPLSEHLIRRTKERAEAEGTASCEEEDAPHRRPRRTGFRKLMWGRKKERMAAEVGLGPAEETLGEDHSTVKYKQSHKLQGKAEFEKVRLKQDLTGIHVGAIWTMEFSICGRLLATAGQDMIVRVWVLTTASHFFHELQAQYQRLGVHSSVDSLSERASVASGSSRSSEEDDLAGGKLPFQDQPLCSYTGHTSDVLDLTWSKNFFLLSSSMDKTVRLWHISRKECLCCFQHVDFVTAVAFHPRDDRYFLSGSLDGKLRLWNIPDKRVALWNEIEGVGSHLITAANFCMNGKLAVVGTYDGRCMFYDTEHLKYHTVIQVKSRHGRKKSKISGVEPLPGEDKLLVTSNDSRVRLYNLKDHELSCKYKGCLNTSSQIKATFSRDGQYVISGSEDNYIYIWRTHLESSKLSSTRKDRNDFYEGFTAHLHPVTSAVFAPVPGITVDEGIREVGEMIVAADYQGSIKIYVSGEHL